MKMKIVRNLIFVFALVIGLSITASAQDRGKKPPPKKDPPVVVVDKNKDKNRPKDRPKNNDRDKDKRRPKPY